MTRESLDALCEQGSRHLVETRYLEAEAVLARAEAAAWDAREWDTLARLYMPLQEARRQRRQRCGEGVVALNLVAEHADDAVDARRVVENFSHGQLLVAGWQSVAPAVRVRQLAAEHGLYVETFLGAAFPVRHRAVPVVVVVPLADAAMPSGAFDTAADLLAALPPGSVLVDDATTSRAPRRGTPDTFGEVMALWERLHAPFLAAADAEKDPLRRAAAYRRAAAVDYAAELPHQKLSDVAHDLARAARIAGQAGAGLGT